MDGSWMGHGYHGYHGWLRTRLQVLKRHHVRSTSICSPRKSQRWPAVNFWYYMILHGLTVFSCFLIISPFCSCWLSWKVRELFYESVYEAVCFVGLKRFKDTVFVVGFCQAPDLLVPVTVRIRNASEAKWSWEVKGTAVPCPRHARSMAGSVSFYFVAVRS